MERVQKEHQPRRSRESEPVQEVKADTKDGVKLKQHQLTSHEERQISFMHFLLSADDRSIWAEFE